jgi:hypothetical protein
VIVCVANEDDLRRLALSNELNFTDARKTGDRVQQMKDLEHELLLNRTRRLDGLKAHLEGEHHSLEVARIKADIRSVEGTSTGWEPSSVAGQKLTVCKNCNSHSFCRRRSFSEQAWTVLLLWNEINPGCVDQPICEQCYEEMRDILIDRANEIEAAMQQTDEVQKIRQRLSNLAS